MSIEIQIIIRKAGNGLYEATDSETFRVQSADIDWIKECVRREESRIKQHSCQMVQGVLEVPKVAILESGINGQLRLLPGDTPTD